MLPGGCLKPCHPGLDHPLSKPETRNLILLANRDSHLYPYAQAQQNPLPHLQEAGRHRRPRLPVLQRALPHHRSGQVGQRTVCDLVSCERHLGRV